jgi:hypothetical protein
MGLRLTPAQRLQWLEQTMEEGRRIMGAARRAETAREASSAWEMTPETTRPSESESPG